VSDKSFRNPQASRWLDFQFGPNELDCHFAIVANMASYAISSEFDFGDS
jgi:hypothetical protein